MSQNIRKNPQLEWAKPATETVETLQKGLKIQKIYCELLANHGISDYEQAKRFFRPDLGGLHQPFLMKDMDIAVARLQKALQNREHILIYGDYDVDGTTGAALLVDFLRKKQAKVSFYIPDRYDEGYGISQKGVEWAKNQSCGLIISVDCGINAPDKVAWAMSQGIDFIICDHHLPSEAMPAATAILNPKLERCAYPFKELSGCAIGFKLLHGLYLQMGWDLGELWTGLDLVVLAIACDYVSLTDENRIMAHYGLKQLNENPRLGLSVLKSVIDEGEDGYIYTIQDLVFKLGPVINAAGRIEHAKEAVQLFLSQSETLSNLYAHSLISKNNERKALEKEVVNQARAQVLADAHWEEKQMLILYQKDWYKGVLGIVAAKMAEEFLRPTLIFCQSNGEWVGSGRTFADIDLHGWLEQYSDYFSSFGGHKAAAGMSLKEQNLLPFIQKIQQQKTQLSPQQQPVSSLLVSGKVELAQINSKFWELLSQFAPFGTGNMRPLFYSERVRTASSPRLLKDSHIKMQLLVENAEPLDAIAFGMPEAWELVNGEKPFNIGFIVQENYFKGQYKLQLEVRYISPCED